MNVRKQLKMGRYKYKDQFTENYKNCWWNGDIMVCHISGEEIDIL